jgi:transposase-like protein
VKRLFYDIETSPGRYYAWRAGWKVRLPARNCIKKGAIICISYKWEGKKKVHSITWMDGDDRDMVAEFVEVARTADEIVAHNGDKFDLRWINKQCLMYNLPRLGPITSVDTLKIARNQFNLDSNALNDIAFELFGQRKIKTDWDWWVAIESGEDAGKVMKKMVRYCEKDVRLLQRVYKAFERFAVPKTHAGAARGRDRWTCPECGARSVYRNKLRHTAMGMERHQMVCKKCHRTYSIVAAVYAKYLAYKNR